ncbi:hypothetical protein HELRODRAFT_170276 [Helobdella robusta]|uniref:Uncharacterized protein n=1 Tax=Helobdella robusta TaxID=6412 RepID=T1F2V5_HELRO|nr:hypothetical protein HELRODRAFT_170276 [Helobdella robusta]ESO07732.1 hypothetical protein HELRODRAFT_170276 [Helobdella robusta]
MPQTWVDAGNFHTAPATCFHTSGRCASNISTTLPLINIQLANEVSEVIEHLNGTPLKTITLPNVQTPFGKFSFYCLVHVSVRETAETTASQEKKKQREGMMMRRKMQKRRHRTVGKHERKMEKRRKRERKKVIPLEKLE